MNNPELYATSNKLQYHGACDIIREFSEEFKRMEGRIIDIGCGPGVVTKDVLLPNLGKNAVVVGADISAAMLEYAKIRHKDEEKMSFIQLDIETSNLPENLIGQFDHAFSSYCFNWIRNMKVTTENIYKLLRPGGKTILIYASAHFVFESYLKQQKDPKFSAYMQDALKFVPLHYGDPKLDELLRKEFERAGFKVLHCATRPIIHSFETIELLLDMYMSANPFVHRMPEDIRRQYREDMEVRIRNNLKRSKKDKDTGDCNVADDYTALVAFFEKPLNK